jgi:hypothetical protein
MHADHIDRRAAAAENEERKYWRRVARRAREGPDYFDMLLMIPYCQMSSDNLEHMQREAREKAEEAEHRRCRTKLVHGLSKSLLSGFFLHISPVLYRSMH